MSKYFNVGGLLSNLAEADAARMVAEANVRLLDSKGRMDTIDKIILMKDRGYSDREIKDVINMSKELECSTSTKTPSI